MPQVRHPGAWHWAPSVSRKGKGVRLAEQTNRQLRILSVLTALFLPPTLITGLFGMNVTGLPFGAEGGGFWWVTAVIALVCAATLWALAKAGVLK